MIPFNKPLLIGKEYKYVSQVFINEMYAGDGFFTIKCNDWLKKQTACNSALITTSATHALEMAAILADIKEGDEVIMPSFTFVSTANAFVLRGAKIIFIDIRPDTMNIDENLIEQAVTNKTKAVVPVHYAGISCEMDKINDLARRKNFLVIEDAAQGLMSNYKGKSLGSIGDFGCFSFHETKNIHCGEGGAFFARDVKYAKRAEIIREKGTNRSQFFRGQINKYSWIDIGSSYLPSELNAAFLYAQLEEAENITMKRKEIWQKYYKLLCPLKSAGLIDLPFIPDHIMHNAHLFYIKLNNIDERSKMINYLKENGVQSVFHYIPLHSSEAGGKFGEFRGEDKFTTKESERLLRLPLFYKLENRQIDYICKKIYDFFKR